jgi:hypothetical protein
MNELNSKNYETLIGIDDQVLAELTVLAEPFVDDPNSVLRRVLGIENGSGADARTLDRPKSSPSPSRKKPAARRSTQKPPRAPKGSLTPEEEFEQPILAALADAGGSLPFREAMAEVGRRMDQRLNEHDRFSDEKGVARWEKRVPFVRLKLVERGLLDSDAPRGIWRLTDAGREALSGTLVSGREGTG